MQDLEHSHRVQWARIAGISLLATIAVGIATVVLIAGDIDINLSADVEGTARAMLDAELRLRAKAYVGLLVFGLEAAFGLALFLVLQQQGRLLAGWSLALSLAGGLLSLSGAVHAMNAAEIAGDPAYRALSSEAQRLLLAGLQATSDYTSFHLGLVLTSAAKAGFFWLFLRSGYMPTVISGWGLFASCFVAFMIVARDFLPVLGHNAFTLAFMVSNMVALLATGLYLSIKGVRPASSLAPVGGTPRA